MLYWSWPFAGDLCHFFGAPPAQLVRGGLSGILLMMTGMYYDKMVLHCTAGQQKEQLEKSEFSQKLPSYMTFCRPGVTDDCTNQFLVKF